MDAQQTTGISLTPRDIIDIILRRRWVILTPIFLVVIAGGFLAFFLPKIYEARTLILVQGQKVPTDYVRSVVTDDVDSRVNTISQQIMSRTNLERVIEQFDLFSSPRDSDMFLEDKLEKLHDSIKVDVMREHRSADADAFAITFQWTDPQKAMQVVNELTRYFIDTNIKVREAQAMGTSDFLADELGKMRKELGNIEAALKEYRQAYMGELPEQLESNLAILQRLQEQLNSKQDSLRETKVALSLLDQQTAEGRTVLLPQDGYGASSRNRIDPLDSNDPAELRKYLADLQMRYTDRHPDVIRLKKRIAEMEAGEDPSATDNASQMPRIADPVQQQRAELMKDRISLEADIQDLQSQIGLYQRRVENTPRREQELQALKRDYENVREVYNSLLNRKMEAELAVSMERKQKGEQFFVLDHAKLPQKPVAPDMKKLLLVTIVAGFGLGGGLAYLLEYMDGSFRKVDQIEAALNIPVIATIPPILTKVQIRKRRILSGLSIVFAGFVCILTGVFAVITLKGPEQVLEIVRRYIAV